MSTNLGQITLTGFRGASRSSSLSFSGDKKITMIFGENGTGKSSIVDAFAFVCDQSIGSLEDRSGGKIAHLTSIAAKPEDLAVGLTTKKGNWTARLSGSTILVTPNRGAPPVRILRRARITQLIEAEPKARFEELKSFIAVPGIDSSEKNLREAGRTVDKLLKAHIAAYIQANSGLNAYWEKEGKTEGSAMAWAKKEESQDVSLLIAQVSEIKKLLELLSVLETKKGDFDAKKISLDAAKEAHGKAIDNKKAEEQKFTSRNSEILALLREAKIFIVKTEDLSNCPVCGNSVDQKALISKLTSELDKMTSLASATAAVSTQERLLRSATENLSTARNSYILSAKPILDQFFSSQLNSLSEKVLDREKIKGLETQSEDTTLLQADYLLSKIEDLRDEMELQSKRESSTVDRRNAVVTYLEQISEADRNQKAANGLQIGLTSALKVVETSRKDYVSQVLQEISKEVDRMYSFMHPDESMSGLRLHLKPKVQGSLELNGNFHDRIDVAPQAYFSESHLDTLGLCIFLALAKKYTTDDTIVILDDVVTSVDSVHLERFIDLIDAECSHFDHVLITTHYRPWRERYRYHQAPSSKMRFMELKRWTLSDGLNIHSTRLAVDELSNLLNPRNFDRQAVASTSGILLEGIFDNLSLRYALKLARKQPSVYTLGELMGAFDKSFVSLLKVEHYDEKGILAESIEIKPLLESLRGLTWIRNQVGAHFNRLGEEISDHDVQQFGEATLAFAHALICRKSGEIPHKNLRGFWESAGGRTCMYPLTTPGSQPVTN